MPLRVAGATLEQERGFRPRLSAVEPAERRLSPPNWAERASTWGQYQRAFDYQQDRQATESYLHDIFYQQLAMPLPRAGHAFGMVLERWLRGHGIDETGSDVGVAELNLRQLGRAFLGWIHEARLRGEGHMPGRQALRLAREFSAGGPRRPYLVCLTSPSSLASGHVVLVQGVELVRPRVWALDIFDPSSPENGPARSGQAGGWLCVEAASDQWRYRMGDGTWWEGSARGGGEFLVIPSAVLREGCTSFVPDGSSNNALGGAARALITVEGSVRSAGLTDGAGRAFFDRGAVASFDPNDPSCLSGLGDRPSVTRWTAFGGLRGGVRLPEAYLADLEPGARLLHRLRGERQGTYAFTVLQGLGCAMVRGACGEGGVAFSLEGAPRVPRLRVESDRRQTIEVLLSVMADPARRHTVHLAGIGLWPGAPLQFDMDASGRALTITNGGPTTQIDISTEVRCPASVRRESMSRRPLAGGMRVAVWPGADDQRT